MSDFNITELRDIQVSLTNSIAHMRDEREAELARCPTSEYAKQLDLHMAELATLTVKVGAMYRKAAMEGR